MISTSSASGTIGRDNSGGLLCLGPVDDLVGSTARPSGLFNTSNDGSYSTARVFNPGDVIDTGTGLTGWGVLTSNNAGFGLSDEAFYVGFRTSNGNFGWMNLILNEDGTTKNTADDTISIVAAFVETTPGQSITVTGVPEPSAAVLVSLGSLLTFRRRRGVAGDVR